MSGGEQFVINVHMTGVPQTEAGAAKVAAANREMGASAEQASARSAAASKTVSAQWAAAGTRMSSVGKRLNRSVTLPIVALGAAAVKMSLDFTRSMTEVSTQAGASRKEVETLTTKMEALGSAGRFSQGPQELAESIFDIESVGFRGAKALDALKSASDLATVGNADLESTTSALVGTLKTGIKGAGNMRQAIGTLNATIGAGKMHMEDLNGAIGTGFIGSAKGLGLSLTGVGAALAELTSQGVPANSAATRLRMTFSLLANPTEKAQDVLASIGIGSEDLAKRMRSSGGVITALELLEQKMHGLSQVEQAQLLSSAFGGAKSGGTIVQLLGNLDDLSMKQKEIIENSGHFNESLKETNEDPAVKLAKAWSSVRFEMVKLGAVLLPEVVPALQQIGGVIGGILGTFNAMPDPMQHTVLEFLALAAVAGPILRLGGAFASLGSKVIEGMAAIKGAAIVGDLQAAVSLAMAGEMGGFAMIGAEAGSALLAGVVTGIAVGAGAFAIGNLLTSVMDKDFKDAGFELGGSLIGGVAGFMLGGPVGAAIGAGLGSVGGELVASMFSGGDAKKTMQEKLGDAAKAARVGRKTLVHSSGQVDAAEGRLVAIGKRQSKVTDEIRAAQKRLNAARQQGNLPEVRREEAHLNELKAKQIHLTQQQQRGESLLHAAKVKNAEDARRERTVEVALVRVRQSALEQAQKRERVTRKAYEQAVLQGKPLKEQTERERDLIQAQNRRKGASEKLHGAEKELGASMKEITQKFGKDFADTLRKQIPLWTSTAGQMKKAESALHGLAPNFQTLSQQVGKYHERQETATVATGKGTTALKKFGGNAQDAGGKVRQAKTEVVAGFAGMESKSSAFLGALNEPTPFKAAPAKARGGLMEVTGKGNRDTVPVTEGQVQAMVAPGEILAVINRHQAPLMSQALTNEYGVDGLGGFFSTYDKPHHHAIGGLVEPKVRAGGAFRGGEQKPLHQGYTAAVKYLQQHDGFGRIVANGNRMDALHQPYLWGGGHGGTASKNGPWDCSGGISELLDGAGFKTTPMVSGGFASYGQAGKGKATILANEEHVYGVLGDKGAIGTSDSNPGGGFGWISEYTYRPGFTERHVDLGTDNTSTRPKRGKGQYQKKGFASGGVIVKGKVSTFGPPGEPAGQTAFGGSSSEAGIALNLKPGTDNSGWDNAQTQKWGSDKQVFLVQIAGHSANLPVVDKGPNQSTGRAIDVTGAGAEKLGIAQSAFPTDSIGTATLGSGTATAKAEQVPAVFHGARTKSLSFGSVPKTLHGVIRELGKRVAELHRYRAAVKAAKGKPKVEHAIAANVTALENRITQLTRQRSLLRREAAKKKITRKLSHKLGKVTGYEEHMEAAERAFTIADQTAQQVVDLEPQSPSLPGTATDSEREAAEKKYVGDFTSYVRNQEGPAFEHSLDVLAAWRNTTLAGEGAATRLESGWEKEVRQVDNQIDQINSYTDKVTKDKADWKAAHPKTAYPKWLKEESQKDHANRARLPVLRYRDHEVRKVLGEARDEFYSDRKNPLRPPDPPLAGTGSMEDVLSTIQGTHWPDQHSRMAKLPGKRVPGMFGGDVWDVQTSIEELDLKVNEAVNSGGGSAGAGGTSELDQAKLELAEQEAHTLRRERAVERAQAPVLAEYLRDGPGYLGAYRTGGVLPADGYYYGHKDETVVPSTAGTLQETHVHINGRDGVLESLIDVAIEQRLTDAGKRIGLSRSTPSAPGRRAAMTQGRRR